MSIAAFPFLTQAIEGKYSDVKVTVHDLNLNGLDVSTFKVQLHGAHIKAGDWIQTIFYGASNDPNENANPDQFLVPREPNRHFAFGAGVHRCAGSHLARREMRIGVRMPDENEALLSALAEVLAADLKGLLPA